MASSSDPKAEMDYSDSDSSETHSLNDVTIKIKDRVFQANRKELASAAEYFDVIFYGPLKNRYADDTIICNIDETVFGDLMKFIRDKRSPPEITANNIHALLELGVSNVDDDCADYLKWNMSSNENIFELFRLTCATFKFPLTQNIVCRHIIQHFYSLSLTAEFLKCPFNELKVLLSEYCKPVSAFTRLIRFRDENVIVDAVLRWIYYAFDERKNYFEIISDFIDFRCITTEYVEFMSKKYGMQVVGLNDRTLLKKCITYHLNANPSPDNYSEVQVPLGDYSSSKMLHVFVHYWEKWKDSKVKTFSVNKNQPEWKLSYQSKKLSDFKLKTVTLKEPNNYLYSFTYNTRMDSYCTNVSAFRAHSSIELMKPSAFVKNLTAPPCRSSEFDVCGMNSDSIYWCNSRIHDSETYKHVSNDVSGLTIEEIKRGIYRYDCNLDKWFSVPALTKKTAKACLFADDNLVYLVGGKDVPSSCVQVYDNRTSMWQQWSNYGSSLKNHNRIVGCALNGNIYISDYRVVEKYDLVAREWCTISTAPVVLKKDSSDSESCSDCESDDSTCDRSFCRKCFKPPPKPKLTHLPEMRMVPFENFLFLFCCENSIEYRTNIIDPFGKSTNNWCRNRYLKKFIVREDRTRAEEGITDEDGDRSGSSTESLLNEQWSYRALYSIRDAVLF